MNAKEILRGLASPQMPNGLKNKSLETRCGQLGVELKRLRSKAEGPAKLEPSVMIAALVQEGRREADITPGERAEFQIAYADALLELAGDVYSFREKAHKLMQDLEPHVAEAERAAKKALADLVQTRREKLDKLDFWPADREALRASVIGQLIYEHPDVKAAELALQAAHGNCAGLRQQISDNESRAIALRGSQNTLTNMRQGGESMLREAIELARPRPSPASRQRRELARAEARRHPFA